MKKLLFILLSLTILVISCGGDTSSSSESTTTPGGSSSSSGPEIVVKRINTAISSGSGPYSFGTLDVSAAGSTVAYSVENTGSTDLVVSSLNITGTHASFFTIAGIAAPVTVTAGTSVDFTITYDPSSAGTHNDATVSIVHNDNTDTENPFLFTLSGVGTSSAPEINVKDDLNNNLLAGSGLRDLGSTQVSTSLAAKTFTIQNLGTSVLNVTSVTSSNAAEFVLVGGVAAIPAGGSTTFTLVFSPGAASGYRTSTITVASDDSDEASYTFTASGTGTAAPLPEINVKEVAGSNVYDDGGAGTVQINFGNQNSSAGTIVKTFQIKNVGNANLNITSVTGGGVFTATNVSTSLAAGASTTFTVTFDPAASILYQQTITVNSTDIDEAVFTFDVNGYGIEQEIAINQAGTNVADGATYTFTPSISVGSSSTVIFITIQNTGTDTLTLMTPFTLGTGTNFSIVSQPGSTSLASGGSTVFGVVFHPTVTGVLNDTIAFGSNDINENPYNITLQGTGIAPEITVSAAADAGTYSYWTLANSVDVGASNTQTITISNAAGAAPLVIGGISVSGANASEFSLDLSSTLMTIPAGSNTTFDMTFSPSSSGAKGAVLTILSNDDSTDLDSEENYGITISATANAGTPDINVKQGVTPIVDAVTTYSYASNIIVGQSSTAITFTIENTGDDILTIASVALTTGTQFSIPSQPGDLSLSPGENTTFTVVFNPTTIGLKTDTITIVSDDPDVGTEDSYTFVVSGTGIAPEITVSAAADAGTYSYWTLANSVDVGASNTQTITISNAAGAAPLVIGGISVSGANASEFSLDLSSTLMTIPAGSNTTFDMTFSPSSSGAKGAVLTILSNDDSTDLDSEENYGITISATANAGTPDINMKQGVTPIVDAVTTYSYASNIIVGQSSTAITFTIENTGDDILTIASVALTTGTQFSIPSQPGDLSLSPGENTTFTVVFNPTTIGLKTDTITIVSDDPDVGTEDSYTFVVSGTGIAPEITVSAAADAGTYSYWTLANSVDVGASNTQTITISNAAGAAPLVIGGISVSGTNASEFSLDLSSTLMTIPAGSNTTFDMTFSPSSSGAKGAVLTILSNDDSTDLDSEENYGITISATANAGTPDINVKQGVTPIVDAVTTYSFMPNVTVSQSSTIITFTIENTGDDILTIASVALTTGTQFSIPSQPGDLSLSPGENTTFTVVFNPTTIGLKTDTITIVSDDPDVGTEDSYTFVVSGTGIAPEITVSAAADAGTYSYWTLANSVDVGASNTQTITISNAAGAAPLVIGGISVSGTNASEFSLDLSSTLMTIPAGSNTTFDMTFSPSSSGAKGAVLTILSNDDSTDLDSEENYGITISATANAGTPDINVKQGVTPIVDAVTTYSYASNIIVGQSSTAITFTIENTGDDILTIASVALTTGTQFSIPSQPGDLSLSPGENTTFTVVFNPTTIGLKTDTITIVSDDPDVGTEDSYTFVVSGTGIAPEITVSAAADAGTYSYWTLANSVDVGASNTQTITISNAAGAAPLVIGGISVSGTNASEFSLDLSSTLMTIPAGSNTTFDMTFSPSSSGAKGAVLTILSNDDSTDLDSEENYGITISATANAGTPDINVKQGVAPIVDAVTTYSFMPNVTVSQSSTIITFTIENTGDDILTIASVALTTGTQFSIPSQPGDLSLSPGENTTFTVVFNPTTIGLKTDTITIVSDDPDVGTEDSYTFVVSGTGIAPEITVSAAADAGTYSYWTLANSVDVGASNTQTITISNAAGAAPLVIGGISVSGTNASEFSLDLSSTLMTIPAGSNTTFDMTFSPSSSGAKGAVLTILSNDDSTDLDSEENYGITISATANAGTPDINVKQGVTPIVDAVTTYSFMPNVTVSQSSTIITFTIENTGDDILTIASVALTTGTQFSIPSQPGDLSLSPGENTTFTVVFNPTTIGLKTDTITIVSDDPDVGTEDSYTFVVSGTGIAPEITVSAAADAGTYSYWTLANSVDVGASNTQTITISNAAGAAPLVIGGISVSGANASEFSLDLSSTLMTIPAGSNTTFDMTFSPSSSGAKGAVLTILSNDDSTDLDSEENYGIIISATANASVGTVIDSSENTGEHSSIVAITSSKIYIAYYDYNNGEVKFARSVNGGTTWNKQVIEYIGDYSSNERNISLFVIADRAADGDDVYIAYYDQVNTRLRVAYSVDGGSSFTKVEVDNTADIGKYCSIAVVAGAGPATDHVYISSYDSTTFDLKFAYSSNGGGVWANEIVDSTGIVGLYTSIKAVTDVGRGATAQDDIYISHYDVTNSNLRLARFNNDSVGANGYAVDADWILTDVVVNAGTDVGKFSSLGIIAHATTPASDKLYVSYYDATGANLNLLFNRSLDGGATWGATVPVDSANDVGQYSSIFVVQDRLADGDDVYISYYDAVTFDLKLAVSINGGTSFPTVSVVDSTESVGEFSSISVIQGGSQATDALLISYYDDTNTYLKFTKSLDGGTTW